MLEINRTIVLNSLIKHETLTIDDIAKEENLGMIPNKQHLQLLLTELHNDGFLDTLNGVIPCTYTITNKGITEGARIKAFQMNAVEA